MHNKQTYSTLENQITFTNQEATTIKKNYTFIHQKGWVCNYCTVANRIIISQSLTFISYDHLLEHLTTPHHTKAVDEITCIQALLMLKNQGK